MTQKPPRKTGLSHLLAATTYSLGGLQRLWHEAAFRQEVLAIPVIVALLWFVDATPVEYAAMGILMLILIATEAVNTAIEELVDHLSPDWSLFARHAKDLGSLAVMCLLLANGLALGVIVFF